MKANESAVKQYLRELENVQRKLMAHYQLKERLECKQQIQSVKNNIDGGVNEAAKNLTMFTKDTVDDVLEMKHHLEKSQDEIIDRERSLRQQAGQIKELNQRLAAIERKKEAFQRQ